MLFTQSADVGRGYKAVWPVNKTHLSLDASSTSEGAEIVLSEWDQKDTL